MMLPHETLQGTDFSITMTMVFAIEIGRDTARHVLNHYYGEYYEAGSFMKQLILAAVHADDQNLLRIALGFPEVAAAVGRMKYTADGSDYLREIAAS